MIIKKSLYDLADHNILVNFPYDVAHHSTTLSTFEDITYNHNCTNSYKLIIFVAAWCIDIININTLNHSYP